MPEKWLPPKSEPDPVIAIMVLIGVLLMLGFLILDVVTQI